MQKSVSSIRKGSRTSGTGHKFRSVSDVSVQNGEQLKVAGKLGLS